MLPLGRPVLVVSGRGSGKQYKYPQVVHNHSVKSIVENKGYRKFLKTTSGQRFVIDEQKVRREARFDGKWVLQTDTDMTAEEVALKYKELWMVEAAFPSIKWVLLICSANSSSA